MEYRRACKRIILNDSAILLTKEGVKKYLVLKDLSGSGAGVFGDCSLKCNDRVTVFLNVPIFFDKLISRQARVAWCTKVNSCAWEAGLDFEIDKIDLRPKLKFNAA